MYRPAVCFTLGEAAATTAYQSKIGGTPYLPKNAEYPYHAEKKHPLTLVAQINFSEVPPLPGFPERGILQVFVDGLRPLQKSPSPRQPKPKNRFSAVFSHNHS